MTDAKWRAIGMVWLVLLSSGCISGTADAADQGRSSSALFAIFETVFYAAADLLSANGGYKQLSEERADALRVPFAALLGGLHALSERAPTEVLSAADGALVGASNFRAPGGPTGLGPVRSTFCYIVVLRRRGSFAFHRWIVQFPVAAQVEPAIWKWTTPPFEGHPTPPEFYAAQVGDAFLLIANNLDELKAVVAKLESARDGRVGAIRDWATLRRHEMWGYRRYRHDDVDKMAAGTDEVTPDAEALAFMVDLEKRVGVLRLHSSTRKTAEKWGRRILPAFKLVSRGTWEATVPLADAQAGERMFVIMALFGFGVYL